MTEILIKHRDGRESLVRSVREIIATDVLAAIVRRSGPELEVGPPWGIQRIDRQPGQSLEKTTEGQE